MASNPFEKNQDKIKAIEAEIATIQSTKGGDPVAVATLRTGFEIALAIREVAEVIREPALTLTRLAALVKDDEQHKE